MDDSDLDFSDLCSRLLKRKVRKKTGEDRKTGDGDGEKSSRPAPSGPRQTKKTTSQLKKTRTKKETSSETVGKVDSEPRAVLQAVSVSQLTENGVERQVETQLATTHKGKGEVKEKVLSRMQRFKRVDPQKLQHTDSIPSTSAEPQCIRHPSSPEQSKGVSSELLLDERLALRLQQELDKEYETQEQERRVVDVDQGGLFFCQLCFRDLSAMTAQLRTQHINRCLDQSENQAAPAAPRPPVPECPICGKGFKSLKSRSTHLKRCSADMGVPPAVLLQALQRQATETTSDGTAGQSAQAGGSKRRNPSDPSQPVRKRPKKTAQPMDEDTMVALALSRSLLDQEVEMERAKAVEVVEVKEAEPQISVATALQWKPAGGAGKGKRRRKGAPAAPPPLLLRQDPEEALRRLQERVSFMLLRSRTPTPPPTPTLPPSTLLLPLPKRASSQAEGETPYSCPSAPLWYKSALPAGYGHAATDFYTPELSAFIQPYTSTQRSPSSATAPVKAQAVPPSKPPTAAEPIAQIQPRSPSPAASTSTPTSLLPSQAVQDLLELGEKGLNLAALAGRSHADAPDQLSGRTSPDSESRVKPNNSLSLSRLASDLSSMVNNPQLSDVQLQVDSGEVLFAHSFMLYARCPLLVEQVHASGFGVQEEGMPPAQRVLLGEVPAGAVLTLLQFLYTAQCPLTPSLAPHVQELASRFDMPELSQECQRYLQGREAWEDAPAQELAEASEEQDDSHAQLHFLQLLRSMWSSEDEEGEEEGQGDGWGERGERSVRIEEQRGEGEENVGEEHVDEEELEEIYEFAATQRRGGESALKSLEEEEDKDEEEEDGGGVETVQEEVRMCFEIEEDKSYEQVGEGSKGQGLEVDKLVQVETPAGTGDCPSLPNSHHRESSSSLHKGGSEAVLDAHESTTEKVNQDADQLYQTDLAPSADPNLDDSFNHLFSQSWGEYAEPSPTQPTQKHQSKSKPNLVRVIDLSISPTPPTCEPSLPVPGLSPELTITRGSQALRMSPELTITQGRQRASVSSELTLANGGQISPELTVTRASQRLTMSPELTLKQGSQRLRLSLKFRERPSSQVEALPLNSQAKGTEQRSKEVELIVLSDSSDESPTCLSPSPPPPPMCPQSAFILPENSPDYTCIKDIEKAKDSNRKADPLKDSCGSPGPASDPSAKAHPSPSAPGSAWAADSPGDRSLLDGSAEVSWLVPSTPHISNRTCSSSTQTQSSMCRTRLFPGSSFSQSPPCSSSTAPGLSKAPFENSMSCKEEQEEVSVSNQVPTTSHPTQTKLEGSRLNVTVEDSPVFLPPKSLSRQFSSTTDQTTDDSHRGASVERPSFQRFGQPVSSTPLHSALKSSLSSHPLADSPFSSQVEKNQHVRNSNTAPRGSVPSDGSPERRGLSRHLSHLKDGVSLSSDQEEACMSKSSSQQKDSLEGSDPGSSERPKGVSEHCTSSAEVIDMNRVENDNESEIKGMGMEEEKDQDESPQQSFSNYDEPAMPFDEPAMPFDEPPMAYDDPPMAFEDQPIACAEPPMTFDEPPMAFNDSWGFGDCRDDLQKPRFSLRLESSGDATSLNSSTALLGPQALPTSLPTQGLHQPAAADRTPPALSPEPQPSTSVLDPKLWDSWEEEEEEGGGSARPLSQRLGTVAPAKRVAQLRTPVASKKTGPLVPITPMPHYSDLDTPELKNKLNRFGVRPLPKKQMVQKLKEIFQYTHQLETSESEDEALVQGHRPRPVSCAQSLKFKEPSAPPAVSPRKVQLSLDAQEPLSLSQSSNASSASQESERSNPELPVSDSDSSSDSEVTASQAVSRTADKLQAVRRFILSDPELHSQVLQYRPLVLSQLQEHLKAAGIRLGASKLLDFLDAQCITFTTAKPGQKAPSRRKRKKKAVVAMKVARAAAEGGARGRGGRKRGGAAGGPD